MKLPTRRPFPPTIRTIKSAKMSVKRGPTLKWLTSGTLIRAHFVYGSDNLIRRPGRTCAETRYFDQFLFQFSCSFWSTFLSSQNRMHSADVSSGHLLVFATGYAGRPVDHTVSVLTWVLGMIGLSRDRRQIVEFGLHRLVSPSPCSFDWISARIRKRISSIAS